MPVVSYVPPTMRRQLYMTDDPNSPTGSNADVVAAAGAPFTLGVIPDGSNLWTVENFDVDWGPSDIDYGHLITGNRAGPPMVPFKELPVLKIGGDSHRWLIERALKLCMGGEGAITGGAVYEVDSLGLGGASAGTVVVSFIWNGNVYTTAAIPYNASNAALQAALLAATGPGPALAAGTITVSAGPLPAAATITYSGATSGPITGQTATPTGLTGGTVTYTRTTPGSGAPYVHPIKGLGMGASQLPLAMAQCLRDALNIKLTGIAFESVECSFDSNGPGKVQIQAHPLYGQIIDDHLAQTVPTGVIAEPNVQPMLLRDLVLKFDGGATAKVGVSAFRFGYQNNNTYDYQTAGLCVVQYVGSDGRTYKQWFPGYHRITGRPTGTYGFDLLDSDQAVELKRQWRQVESFTATVVDPGGSTDQIAFVVPKGVPMSGGVGPAAATGRLSSQFNGQFFFDPATGTDCTVNVSNNRSTPIAVI